MEKNVDINTGLSASQVESRVRAGLVNYDDAPKTKTIGQIIRDNFFTYFNFLNLMLGAAVFTASLIKGNSTTLPSLNTSALFSDTTLNLSIIFLDIISSIILIIELTIITPINKQFFNP